MRFNSAADNPHAQYFTRPRRVQCSHTTGLNNLSSLFNPNRNHWSYTMKTSCKLVVIFIFTLFIASTQARAQKGKFKLPPSATSTGVHTDSQAPITNFEVYLLGPGTTANGTPNSYISCDNDDGGVTVGSDDSDTTCYAVPDSSGNFNLTGLYYGFTDGTGCTTGAAQPVYIEVRKGTIGTTNNSTIALMAVPPSAWNCDYLYSNPTTTFFDVTEFTNTMAA